MTASVSSSGGPVDEGKVKLSVVNGSSKSIGAATGTLTANSNGNASATLGLPAYTSVGSYTIEASYSDSTSRFGPSSDNGHTLSIATANTTVTASSASASYSTGTQDVTLTANVSSGAGTVNEGKVKFTVLNSAGTASMAAGSASVIGGTASDKTVGLPANLLVGSYTIEASYTDSSGNFGPSSDNSQSLTVSAPSTTTTATSTTATFSTGAQDVTLTANVSSTGNMVNEGSVTFTILQGNTVIGHATTSNTVSNGQASVSYLLPANTNVGSYTIDTSYSDSSGNFQSSNNASQPSLRTVLGVPTTTTASSVTTTFSTGSQSVTLTAQVSSNGTPVNGGTVTFALMRGNSVIGTATTSGTVRNGQAHVSYLLPTNLPAGNYTISAIYNPASGLAASSDVNQRPQPILTVAPAATTITASNVTVHSSHGIQTVTLTAQVQSTAGVVNEGTVTFTILQGSKVIGTAATSTTVHNGQVSVSYTLPASLPAGFYTIEAVYNPGGDFRGSADLHHLLYVSPV